MILQVIDDTQEEFLVEHGKLRILEDKEQQVISEHYDLPIYRHLGVAKTVNIIRRNYDFLLMRQKVATYIKKCDKCQRNKAARHETYGQLQNRLLLKRLQLEIAIDFIVKLPKSTDKATGIQYNSILVVVDRLIKYSYFIAYKEAMNAEQLGMIVYDRIIRYYGILATITSDRDKLFTSNYQKTLIGLLGIKQTMSTAFYLQTDGQTERSNQTLEQYLRYYINSTQNNQVLLLPVAQLAINNHVSDTIGVSPYRANFGKDPNVQLNVQENPIAEKAIQTVEGMQKTIKEL